jgi:hypothetical protein
MSYKRCEEDGCRRKAEVGSYCSDHAPAIKPTPKRVRRFSLPPAERIKRAMDKSWRNPPSGNPPKE